MKNLDKVAFVPTWCPPRMQKFSVPRVGYHVRKLVVKYEIRCLGAKQDARDDIHCFLHEMVVTFHLPPMAHFKRSSNPFAETSNYRFL